MTPRSRPHWTLILLAAGALASGACGRSELDTAAPPDASSGSDAGGGLGGILPQLPPSPGFLICGTQTCAAGTQQCCLGVGGTGTLDASCASSGGSCAGVSLRCDEPADCAGSPGLDTCCFGLLSTSSASGAGGSLASGVTLGSRCESRGSCAGLGQLILCRKDSDCGPGAEVCCPGVGVPTCQATCTTL